MSIVESLRDWHSISSRWHSKEVEACGDFDVVVKTLTLSGITLQDTSTIRFSMNPIPFNYLITQTPFGFMAVFA